MLSVLPLHVLSSELLSLSASQAQCFLSLHTYVCVGPFHFGVHKLLKICALWSLLIKFGPTCAPAILGQSTILVEATAVACFVALEQLLMFLALDTMLVGPAHLLGYLWNSEVNRLHLALPFSPFWLVQVRRLVIKIGIVLNVL